MGCSKKSSNREFYSNTGLSQKQVKSQLNNLTYYLKELEKNKQAQS